MECFTTVDLPVATKTDKHYRRNPQNIVECVGLLVSFLPLWDGERFRLNLMGQASVDTKNKNGYRKLIHSTDIYWTLNYMPGIFVGAGNIAVKDNKNTKISCSHVAFILLGADKHNK